jgi:hypothetical protein
MTPRSLVDGHHSFGGKYVSIIRMEVGFYPEDGGNVCLWKRW